jgi:hypothetical protein
MSRPLFGFTVGSHVQRIGALRVFVGCVGMALCLPTFLWIHLCFVLLGQPILLLLGLPAVRHRDHMYFGRYRIARLSWLDIVACEYCAYVNGIHTMGTSWIDRFAQHKCNVSLWKAGLLAVLYPMLFVSWWIPEELTIRLLYGALIARPLGMSRTSRKEVDGALKQESFASNWGLVPRRAISLQRNLDIRASLALAEVESAYCPLRPPEPPAVPPYHHDRFFRADQLGEMRMRLVNVGTVLNRVPTCQRCSEIKSKSPHAEENRQAF